MGSGAPDARLDGRNEASDYRRIELITGRRRRREWSDEEKTRIVAESAAPGSNISAVARRHDVSRGLLTVWRRGAGVTSGEDCGRSTVPDAAVFVPVEVGGDEACAGRRAGRARISVALPGGRIEIDAGIDPHLAAAVIAAMGGRR